MTWCNFSTQPWDGQKLDLEIKLMSCSLRIYFLVQALAMTHKSVKSLQLVEESKLIGMVLLWLWEVGKWNVVWFCLTQVSVCQCPGRAHDLKSCHHPCLGRESNLWTWGANQVILPLSYWDGQKLDLEIKLMSCSLRIYLLDQAKQNKTKNNNKMLLKSTGSLL